MLPSEKDAVMPDTDFNGGSDGKAACEDKEVVADHNGKGEVEEE